MTNLRFRTVSSPGAADMRLLMDENEVFGAFLGYFYPPGEVEAAALHASARDALQQRLYGNREAYSLHVLQLACDFWRRSDVATHYQSLAVAAGNRREQALLELVYGQLLMARKLHPATGHLDSQPRTDRPVDD